MYRAIVLPYAIPPLNDSEMTHVSAHNGRQNRRGYYEYAYRTVQEARTAAEQAARTHQAQGCSVFILDDEEGVIVERSRAPRRPAFVWESVRSTNRESVRTVGAQTSAVKEDKRKRA